MPVKPGTARPERGENAVNIHKLEVFLTLADTLNFTQTAQLLYISQTAVSQQIRSLEEELDAELFARSSRSVRLTDAGEAFRAHAQLLFQQYRDMLDAIAPYTRQRHPLRIEYTGPIEQEVLRQAIAHYRFAVPHALLTLRYASQTRAKNDLINGACDVVFSVEEEMEHEAVTAIPVCSNPVCVAVSAQSELAHYPKLTVQDLRSRKVILLTQDSAQRGNQHVRRMLADLGFSPEQVEETNSIESQLFLIEMDMGISLLPAAEVLARRSIAFVSLEGLETVHRISLIYRTMTPQLEAFIEAAGLEGPSIPKGNR